MFITIKIVQIKRQGARYKKTTWARIYQHDWLDIMLSYKFDILQVMEIGIHGYDMSPNNPVVDGVVYTTVRNRLDVDKLVEELS